MHKLNYDGSLSTQVFKREKAKKAFEKLKTDILGDYIGKIKYGTQRNMGFRYGDFKEVHDNKGNVIETRTFAVDFNGTRELLYSTKPNKEEGMKN